MIMDCNNTVDFIKEWNRMCDSYDSECRYCPIEECKLDIEDCLSWVCNEKNIEKAIEIVQEWSKENPIKTRLSLLKEQYPNVRLNSKGIPLICMSQLYNVDSAKCDADCIKCWNTTIKD